MKKMKTEFNRLLALFEQRLYEEAASACQVALKNISEIETRSAVHDLMSRSRLLLKVAADGEGGVSVKLESR